MLLALAGPQGIAALPDILDAARLSQARVTKDLRIQARAAVEGFLQSVLDDPANADQLRRHTDRDRLARSLWQEGLVLVYRLLFILKLEGAADPSRSFSFAATALWRHALSPNQALGKLVRRHLDHGHETGRMLADGLRTVFRVFREGLSCSELCIAPLGGALFSGASTSLLDALNWREHAVALLLDRLLWTTPKGRERERIQYGPFDVEELGRVYEALLELEPGIALQPMMRLRRARLEVVVPATRARRYHVTADAAPDDEDALDRGSVVRKQDIAAGAFYLRVGLGRKATGSYYTPHEFVRFLVQETLGETISVRSPDDGSQPGRHTGAQSCRPGDRQRAFPGRSVPISRRGALRGLPALRHPGYGGGSGSRACRAGRSRKTDGTCRNVACTGSEPARSGPRVAGLSAKPGDRGW